MTRCYLLISNTVYLTVYRIYYYLLMQRCCQSEWPFITIIIKGVVSGIQAGQ